MLGYCQIDTRDIKSKIDFTEATFIVLNFIGQGETTLLLDAISSEKIDIFLGKESFANRKPD